jgi:integrase
MASVTLHLYTHKTLKDGTNPILIQVIKDRKRKTFSTGYSAKPEQWSKKTNLPNSKHPNHSLLVPLLKRKLIEAQDIILELENKMKDFTIEDIAAKLNKKVSSDTFAGFTDQLIKQLEENGKDGNARVYGFTKSTFLKNEKPNIKLSEITYRTIKGFQDFLIQRGNSTNTISIHLRTLKAIINQAIKEGLIEKESYPFTDLPIKTEKTRKRAVNKDIIMKVESLDVSKENNLQLYKDLFMFSFYNQGMNFVDSAYLKVKNIINGRIVYTRKKTGQHFSIKITPKVKAIIKKYNDLKKPESYIFPIIKKEGHEYEDYKNAFRLMNKKLKRISELLNLDVNLTTYVSRHSWATIAKKAGLATSVISEGLGHESEEMTQVYLDSFDTEVMDAANDMIIN